MDDEYPPSTASGSSSNTPNIQPQAAQELPQINEPGSFGPESEGLEQLQQTVIAFGDMVYTYQEIHQYLADLEFPPSSTVVRDSQESQDLAPPCPCHPPDDPDPFPDYVDGDVVLRLGDFGYYDQTEISQISSRLHLPLDFEPDKRWPWPEDYIVPGWPWPNSPRPWLEDPLPDHFWYEDRTPDESISDDPWPVESPPDCDWDAELEEPKKLNENWLDELTEHLRPEYPWPEDYVVPGWPWSDDSDENYSDESYSGPDEVQLPTIEFGMLNTRPPTKRRAAIRHPFSHLI